MIDGGVGVDSIENYGDSLSVNGGNGDDSIYNIGHYSTIIGGKGNDFVSSDSYGNMIRYASGDGNDTISGFNIDDTLNITEGLIDTYSVDNNDIVFTVGNGSIRFIDQNGKKINVLNSNAIVTSEYYQKLAAKAPCFS